MQTAHDIYQTESRTSTLALMLTSPVKWLNIIDMESTKQRTNVIHSSMKHPNEELLERVSVCKIIIWGIVLFLCVCLQPASECVCVCVCVWTSHCSETHMWQSISQQMCRAIFLIVKWWTVTFEISGAFCGQNSTDRTGVLLSTQERLLAQLVTHKPFFARLHLI